MKAFQVTVCLFQVSDAIASCRSQAPRDMTACDEPRPQDCTHDYRPDCGYLPGEGQSKTNGNSCTACTDPAVTGWRSGRCKDN